MNRNIPFIVAAIIVLVAVIFGIWKLARPSEVDDQTNQANQQTSNTTSNTNQPANANQTNTPQQGAPVSTTDCTPKKFTSEQLNASYTQKPKFVLLDIKDYGTVKIALNYVDAPKSSQNFAKLASLGFYDCLTFHRVISGFVAQGGDPEGTGGGGPGYVLPAEIKLKHTQGSIAMARLPDDLNPKKDSSGSQFYIALQDLPDLDGDYTVFGNVIEGFDLIAKIGKVQTGPGNKPITPVIITKATTSDK